jgi:ABC-type phosphate/phosphonate transport system ATPase subunit
VQGSLARSGDRKVAERGADHAGGRARLQRRLTRPRRRGSQQFNLVPRLSLLINVCFGFLGRIPVWRGTLGRFLNRFETNVRSTTVLGIVGAAASASNISRPRRSSSSSW